MSATAVREKRQVTLPQDVFEAAGLQVGDHVDWRVEGGDIRGRKLLHAPADLLDTKDVDPKSLLPRKGQITTDSLLKSIDEARERRKDELWTLDRFDFKGLGKVPTKVLS